MEGIPMTLRSRWFYGPCLLLAALGVAYPRCTLAQTWANDRQGPALREILVVDATGEPYWLWGAEDVANDGLAAFSAGEQAIDARTVYAVTDAARFYSRVYFSVIDSGPGEVTSYVFLDTDRSVTTGGPAIGSALEADFTEDPTEGGYEYVIRVQRRNNGNTEGAVFQFSNLSRQFELASAQPTQLVTEAGAFLDPIRINQSAHGYLQSAVDMSLVNLTQACEAGIFVRTTNQTQTLGGGDRVVGRKMNCTPTFTNGNPEIIVNPPDRCTSNEQCPNGGICIDGICRLAPACIEDSDCADDQRCIDGRCVYRGGNGCNGNDDCNGLVCVQGQCVACSSDAACGPGMVCGPDGRCTPAPTGTSTATSTSTTTSVSDAGLTLLADQRLQGGACACSAVGARGNSWSGWMGLLGLSALLARGIKRERDRS